MRRLCSRPGCSSSATTVFGFDPGGCAVWLGELAPDAPRDAGDLCDRHAAAMKPPQGWVLEDRRRATAQHSGSHAPAVKHQGAGEVERKTRKRRVRTPRASATATLPFDGAGSTVEPGSKWATAASDTDDADGAAGRPATPAVAVLDDGGTEAERWTPRFDRDDDLDGLLDAKTPLLGRAFRNIRSV